MNRLLCIVDSLNTGGAETFMMKLYCALDKSKYQIDFIASDIGYYDKEILSSGGKIYYVPLRTKHPIASFLKIKKVVKEEQYTSVLKLGSTPISAIDLLAAKLGGAKILGVRSCNSYADESLIYKFANFLCRPIFSLIVNLKIAPSDLAAEFTFGKKAVQKGEVYILHNAIDFEKYRFNQEKRDRFRENFEIQSNTVYCHIGRFSKQKNHLFLLEIFKHIYEFDANSILVLIGAGELENAIKKKAIELNLQSKILFLGVRDDIQQILSGADLFIFPSLYEGMPNTIIEAQAAGLACIISDTITRQANITNRVIYLPLSYGADSWAKECIICDKEHYDSKVRFAEAGYDIKDIAKSFVSLVFRG